MYRIDDPSAVAELPPPAPAGAPGFFTGGDVSAGTPGTRVRAWWLNMVQEEILAVVAAAGLQPDRASRTQLLQALEGLFLPVSALGGLMAKGVTMGAMVRTSAANPVAGQVLTNTLSFNAARPGLLMAVGSVNLGYAANQQPNGCYHVLTVDGALQNSDSTEGPMTNQFTVGLPAGPHTVVQTYTLSSQPGSYVSIGQNLAYLFVEN